MLSKERPTVTVYQTEIETSDWNQQTNIQNYVKRHEQINGLVQYYKLPC